MPAKQAETELVLERLDLVTDRALGQVQRFGGAGKTGVTRNDTKPAQVVEMMESHSFRLIILNDKDNYFRLYPQ